jgi:hypothetical protein
LRAILAIGADKTAEMRKNPAQRFQPMPRNSIILLVGMIAILFMLGGAVLRTQHTEETRARENGPSLIDRQSSRTTSSRSREAPDLSPEALCARIAKSFRFMGSSDSVYQSISFNLRHYSADEILSLLSQLDTPACSNVRNILDVILLDLLATRRPSSSGPVLLPARKRRERWVMSLR